MKDYILREIEKVTDIIAALAGLKTPGKEDEFIQLADRALLNGYNISLSGLLELDEEDFKSWLEKGIYKADKLDALAQLLYLYCLPFSKSPESQCSLEKILSIFNLLETKYHWQSFENIDKRNSIRQFLNNNNE